MMKLIEGPKHDGKYLHELIKDKLGNTKLHQTLTNIVVPTFDIKNMQPTIFSSYEVIYYPLFFIFLFFFNDYILY